MLLLLLFPFVFFFFFFFCMANEWWFLRRFACASPPPPPHPHQITGSHTNVFVRWANGDEAVVPALAVVPKVRAALGAFSLFPRRRFLHVHDLRI